MDCPKCQSPMEAVVYESFEVNRSHIWYESCPTCYGVFFDAGEFRDYKERTILSFKI